MLKKVLITLPNTTPYLSTMIDSLIENQISYQFVPVSLALNPSPDCLIITDHAKLIAQAKRNQIACLAYACTPDRIFDFSQASMVTEGFLEIDADFLTYVYCRFHHLPVTIAKTSRLLLKELPLCDLENMYHICHHKKIQTWVNDMPDSFEVEKTKHEAYIKNVYEFYGYGYWGVYLKDSGRLIGKCGLQNRETRNGTEIELGYLIDPDFSNNGYATEAANATIDYAFSFLGLTTLIAVIAKNNIASLTVAEKLEFIKEYETPDLLFLRKAKKLSASEL